jgi:hypothetical protein
MVSSMRGLSQAPSTAKEKARQVSSHSQRGDIVGAALNRVIRSVQTVRSGHHRGLPVHIAMLQCARQCQRFEAEAHQQNIVAVLIGGRGDAKSALGGSLNHAFYGEHPQRFTHRVVRPTIALSQLLDLEFLIRGQDTKGNVAPQGGRQHFDDGVVLTISPPKDQNYPPVHKMLEILLGAGGSGVKRLTVV